MARANNDVDEQLDDDEALMSFIVADEISEPMKQAIIKGEKLQKLVQRKVCCVFIYFS